jgi:hypothetical protein
MLRLHMNPRPHRSARLAALLIGACAISACASSPPGEIDASYAFRPATVFGPPADTNVFFKAAAIAGPSTPFGFVTEPLAGHVDQRCTGTTTFQGSKMIVDWACNDATRTWTVDGALSWDGERYMGDCTTSFTSPSFSFANLVVPFEAFE